MTGTSQRPTENEHVAALTGLRGLAALWVLVYHAWVLAGPRKMTVPLGDMQLDFTPFFSCGWAGVQIFFVLSGFLLGLPFAEWQAGQRAKPCLGGYLVRRVRRVFPAYYVQVLALFLVAYAATGRPPIDTWQNAVRHLFMLFVPIPLGGEALNGVWWTLPIEFSFYLLLPVLAVLLRPKRWLHLMGVCLGAMIAWRYGATVMLADAPMASKVAVGSQLPGSLDSFGMGLLGALIHINRDRLSGTFHRMLTQSNLGLVAGLVLIVACLYWIHWDHERYWSNSLTYYSWTPTFSLGLLAVILAATGGVPMTRLLLGSRALVPIGTVSYSVYLWHFPVLEALRQSPIFTADQGYALPILLLLGLIVTLPIAALSYRFVEHPFLTMGRRPAGMPRD